MTHKGTLFHQPPPMSTSDGWNSSFVVVILLFHSPPLKIRIRLNFVTIIESKVGQWQKLQGANNKLIKILRPPWNLK